jgi:hypothetical protein
MVISPGVFVPKNGGYPKATQVVGIFHGEHGKPKQFIDVGTWFLHKPSELLVPSIFIQKRIDQTTPTLFPSSLNCCVFLLVPHVSPGCMVHEK